MSKEFYKYIVNRTIDYFSSDSIRSGEKFILKLNNKEEVEAYYDALKDLLNNEHNKIYSEYVVHNDDEYRTIGFLSGSFVKVFVVPEIEITNAYMTRLRNTVQEGWAMLIVSHSPIDSIAGGTESLQKEGMPFHREAIISDIEKKINKSSLSVGIKELLKLDLNSKKNSGYLDSYSISDYDEIIVVLENKTIADSEFRDFLLFKDDDILAAFNDEKAIKEQIEDNSKLYKKINDSIRFGNPEHDLSKDFSDDFIKRLQTNASKSEYWDDGITYTDVKKAQKKKEKSQKPLMIERFDIFADTDTLTENKDYYIRAEAEKGVKFNRKHILIFNSRGYSGFNIEITFSDNIKNNQISLSDAKTNTSASVSGKKLNIKQFHSGISINRIELKCIERNDKFQFNICIINCSIEWFKSIASLYKIDAKPKNKQPKSLVIICNSDEILLNADSDCEEIMLEDNIELVLDECKSYKLLIDENSFNDEKVAHGKLDICGDTLNILFIEEAAIVVPCFGIGIEQKKLSRKMSFAYNGNNKLMLGTSEYSTQGDLKDSLEFEEYIIKNKILSCEYYGKYSIKEIPLDVDDKVRNAYFALIDYFIVNNTLPSLAYYNEELMKLASEYVHEVFVVLSGFEDKKPLSRSQQDILRLGVVEYPEKRCIAYFPLHPLNVAYQIMLTKEAEDMNCEIRDDILKKLSSDNLMPMIHNRNRELCKVFDQTHSPQWTYYYPASDNKLHGSRNFVSTIVKEKIREFYSHFSYLFGDVGGNKIIINAVNMGDCNNLFKGIINYFKEHLNKEESPDEMLTMIVNVYGDDKTYNVFDCLAHKSLLKKFLNNEAGIKEDDARISENELINCLVSNIRYYRKNNNDKVYEYCHISFIEMDHKITEGNSNNRDIRSSSMLNGLISGTSSTYYGGEDDTKNSYRTGYGSKFNLNNGTSDSILALADIYNSAATFVFGDSNQYITDNVLCTEIGGDETEMIEKTYDASNWVVFIDPKVDLNFFKSPDKDIMIIHYSDQHTTSSGYDAITVTRKTEQYANILREFLIENKVPVDDNSSVRSIIDMFNAVNGDWLLKLISSNSNFQKEKISIQSAIKLALAFFRNDNIIWIPISLEEILRVSGAVGLSQNKGLFTAKKLGYEHGATSDDLLMFGVENRNGQIYVHLYPLEVKIGYKNTDEITKATEQVKRTKKIFDENLISDCNENSLHMKFYRNFIAQLAVISAEKLELYNVWRSQDWEKVFNTEIRGKLLNDEFIVSNDLKNLIGDGVVISFKEDIYMRSVNKSEVTIIKFFKSDAIDYLTKSVDEIGELISNITDISEDLFAKKYIPCVIETDNIYSIYSEMPYTEQASDEVIADEIEYEADNVCIETQDSKSAEGMKILFGHDVNSGMPLYWYPNNTEKVMHPNTGIIGTMGTGKTQFTKSLILQLIQEQKNNPGNEHLGILIFDYKGDYNKSKPEFVDAVNAKVYDLHHLPFNPFSITITPNSKPMLPLHIASTFRDTLSKAYNLGAKQEALLRDSIMQAYAMRGIDKSDKNTWTKPAPVLHDVFNALTSSESFKEDSLYSALSELDEFEIFETDPKKAVSLYNLIDGVTVINLQGYDPSIQNLVVAITLDLFYSQMQANGHSMIDGELRQIKKFILVDEADNFLKQGFSSIRKILKEGREFGVGTILSTQFLKHFDTQQDDFSKYILSWIIHKVDDLSTKDVRNLFNTDTKSAEEELFTSIKKLSKHHSFVKLGDSTMPHYIKDRAFWEILENKV